MFIKKNFQSLKIEEKYGTHAQSLYFYKILSSVFSMGSQNHIMYVGFYLFLI